MRTINNKGSNWDDDIYLYKNYDWYDYGKEMFDSMECKLDSNLENFFNFDEYGKYLGYDNAHEYSEGIIEIY